MKMKKTFQDDQKFEEKQELKRETLTAGHVVQLDARAEEY
jgi:hypothetical protein